MCRCKIIASWSSIYNFGIRYRHTIYCKYISELHYIGLICKSKFTFLGHEIGGTWHFNTYPGCACDVWTTLYQFTFFQNPQWSRFVASAREIKQYLISFTKNFGLKPHIQFETSVKTATWSQNEAMWTIFTNKGD